MSFLTVSNPRLAAEAVDQSVKPVEVELGKNLHLYLQGLGLIPPMSSAAGHKTVAKVRGLWEVCV